MSAILLGLAALQKVQKLEEERSRRTTLVGDHLAMLGVIRPLGLEASIVMPAV